jgi:UDPglucose--hexose-1-phosphate uridylyltransferase
LRGSIYHDAPAIDTGGAHCESARALPELRKDPIVGRWVIISTERARRPIADKVPAAAPPHKGGFCPFCAGMEDKTPAEVWADRPPGSAPQTPGWRVRVVPNKFPALKIEGDLDRQGEGLYDKMNGIGAHEVVIETPAHDRTLADLPEADVERVLWAYRERIRDLKRDERFRYVMVFKNHGEAAGASLEHSHSQLIALPVVPINVSEEMRGARHYFEYKERCIFCDIVKQEIADGRRVIYENSAFVVVAPYAPKLPFETWIMPKAHAASYEESRPDRLPLLANAMRTTLRKLSIALDAPAYNFMLHTAPFADKDAQHYHWHIEIMPTLSKVAGFEHGSGFYINPTPPEDAAAFLRDLAVD